MEHRLITAKLRKGKRSPEAVSIKKTPSHDLRWLAGYWAALFCSLIDSNIWKQTSCFCLWCETLREPAAAHSDVFISPTDDREFKQLSNSAAVPRGSAVCAPLFVLLLSQSGCSQSSPLNKLGSCMLTNLSEKHLVSAHSFVHSLSCQPHPSWDVLYYSY